MIEQTKLANIRNKELQLMQLDILLYFEYKYRIPKSPLFDNEVYYQVYKSDKRYNLIYGGRGSAKSFEICGKLPIVLISCLPFCRILFVRQRENSHRISTFLELCDYINKWQLNDCFKITKSPMEIRHIESGNSITFKGMDNPDTVKSIKDITHVFFEECFNINDWIGVSTINKSVRTDAFKIGRPHKLYFIFNPQNTNHFLYDVFFDERAEYQKKYANYRKNCFKLKTTYKDNKFITPEFVELIEADKEANPDFYQVDALGNWGRIKETGLFYRYFDYSQIVEENLKKRVYNPNLPLHITFDFNVYPYISLEVTQLYFNEKLQQIEVCTIEEICLTDQTQRGDVQKTVIEFIRRYKEHRGDVVVCGDRAGHSRKTNSIPDFATIFAMLQPTPKSSYQTQRDTAGRLVTIDPYPEYEAAGCTFKVQDNTIKTQNPELVIRQAFFERLHQGKLKVLPLDRKYGTINAAGQRRGLSEQYAGVKIVQKIDESCKFLTTDYQELKEDEIKGGKSTRKAELGHTSDAMDYQYCQLFDAELKYIAREMKI